MTMTIHKITIVVVWGILLLPVVGSAASSICPDSIAVEEHLAKPVNTWETVLEEYPHQLSSVGFFDGHPREKAELTPDKEKKSKTKQMATWRFVPNNPQGNWIACAYDRTNVTLVRSLDATVSTCTVTYDPNLTISGRPAITAIKCK